MDTSRGDISKPRRPETFFTPEPGEVCEVCGARMGHMGSRTFVLGRPDPIVNTEVMLRCETGRLHPMREPRASGGVGA